jgi:N,N'-diacetyllegionaminate synthase
VIVGPCDTLRQPLLIAEIGNLHEGSFSTAVDLVHQARQCGVEAVKFQTFRTEHYVSRRDAARFKRLKSFELSYDQFAEISSLARGLGLAFLSTPFDLESANRLEPLVDAYKIASGDNDFYPLIRIVCQKKKPIILSTGLVTFEQVKSVLAYIREQWGAIGHDGSLAVLHCVSCYPVPVEHANLRAIQTMAASLDCEVGYSDHTLGPTACVAAAALGARIIEKHFTLSKTYSDFRDHQLSADPDEMRFLVSAIRDVPQMLGSGLKQPQPCEMAGEMMTRRSIVAAADLPAGHTLSLDDITWVRPRAGLLPGQEHLILGHRLTRSLSLGDPIVADSVEQE